jgi:hypothetical protein
MTSYRPQFRAGLLEQFASSKRLSEKWTHECAVAITAASVPAGRGRGSIAVSVSPCRPVIAQSFPFVLSINTVQWRKMRCDSRGLLGQCLLATVAILGSSGTWNLELTDSIIPETVLTPLSAYDLV